MRSYKDGLVEYLEEKGSNALSEQWHDGLKDKLGIGNSRFQLLQNYPPTKTLNELGDFFDRVSNDTLIDQYEFISANQISMNCLRLVKRLEQFEDSRLPFPDSSAANKWISFKELEKESGINFNYRNSLRSFLKENKLDSKILTASKGIRIKLIEDFYELEREAKTKQSFLESSSFSLDKIEEEVEFSFNLENSQETFSKNWTDSISHKKNPFFISSQDIEKLNSAVSISSISIKGKIKDVQKISRDIENDAYLTLLEKLLDDKENNLADVITYQEQYELKRRLKYRYKSFWLMSGYDFEIEIKGSFNERDAEILRSINFTSFPFYFFREDNCKKWIEYSRDNILRIRTQNKQHQNIIFGAELESLINRSA